MDPLIFVEQNKPDSPVYYACGKCRIFWNDSKNNAERCCAPSHCQDCQKLVEEKHYLVCRACRDERDRKKEAEAFEKAKKVHPDEYTGHMLYWEGGSGDCTGDGYFSSVEAVLDECENNDEEPPEYVWGCDEQELSMNAEALIESALDDWYEDASSQISQQAIDELQNKLDQWCEERAMSCYHPNYKIAVLIPEDWRKPDDKETEPDTPPPNPEA